MCGLALLIAAAVYIVRSRNKRPPLDGRDDKPVAPIPELPPAGIKAEIYTHEAEPQELGRHSVYAPAELDGVAARS